MLALLAIYARADLVAALERAVHYGAYSFHAIERILAVQAKPKTILESLAERGNICNRFWMTTQSVHVPPPSINR